ncbi:xanthine dehydrogenase family protein molybdopterin-binding subunit [Myxococcota bacterium]|nr:xanthine dehydrogenase family protein molybdopterin-binding subunit [Myxococcota bacterium]MBU1898964.1 xanthine dehydrogenase family protein molybdopterin-binding subunit [Myxococcota bacterium]
MLIGTNYQRLDGRAKVTGAARYVDDLPQPEGCLFGLTLRSPHPHARIDAIRRDPGYDWQGITVVTAEDIPGENVVALMTDDQPVLAAGLTRHVTEPIALVAAPTRQRAAEALKHIHVDYTPLPALLDFEIAQDHEIKIYGEDNVFARAATLRGDPDALLRDAELVIEGIYRVGHQEQLYIEPQGLIALPREDGGLTILGSMQCPYYIHKALKRVLGGVDFNVRQTTTGGAFGGKEDYPSIMGAHVALLALKAKAPVKMIYARDEDLIATTKRHPAVIRVRAAVDPKSAKLLAVESQMIFDGGAYNTLSPVVNSRGVLHGAGPYVCEHVRVTGVMVASHTPPNGAFRGFGAPQSQFAMERHMDRIARHLEMDPAELRRINYYRPGDLTPTGQRLDDPAAEEVFERARAWVEAARRAPAPVEEAPGGRGRDLARGVAFVMGFHGAGFTGNGESGLAAKVDVSLEGDRVLIHTASIDMGQGIDTVFPAIVAETLDYPLDKVSCAPHDTATVPNSGPTAASRSVMVVGGVSQKGARQLREALRAALGAGPEATFAELVAARSPEAPPLRVRAQYDDDGAIWDAARYWGDAYPTYAWTAVAVELDVDRDTGEVIYRRLFQATDVGKAMNKVIVEGQLEGGAVQALGYATLEEVVIDARGAMKNNRLTDYIIPTTMDTPELETAIVEYPFAGGPYGAKGIGELPHDVPAAAVAAAIEDAVGVVLDQLPMTPQRVLAALMMQEEEA